MSLPLATPKTSGLGINHSHSNSWSLPQNGFSPCICSLPSHSAFRTAHTTHDGHFRCIVPGCFHGRIPIPSPAPLHEELLQAHIQAQNAKAQFAYQQYYATDILPHITPPPSTPPSTPPSPLPDLGDFQLPLKKKKKNKKKKNHISPPPSPTISLTPPSSPTPIPPPPTKKTNHAALQASKRLQKRNLLLDSQKRLFEIHTSPWFKDFQKELSSFDFSSLKPAGTYQSPATIAFKAERKRLKKLRRKNSKSSTPTPTTTTTTTTTTTPTPPTTTPTTTTTTTTTTTPPTTHTFTSAWNTPNTSNTPPELPFLLHTSHSHTKKLHRRLKGAQRGFHLSQTIFTHAEAKDVKANRIAQLHASKR